MFGIAYYSLHGILKNCFTLVYVYPVSCFPPTAYISFFNIPLNNGIARSLDPRGSLQIRPHPRTLQKAGVTPLGKWEKSLFQQWCSPEVLLLLCHVTNVTPFKGECSGSNFPGEGPQPPGWKPILILFLWLKRPTSRAWRCSLLLLSLPQNAFKFRSQYLLASAVSQICESWGPIVYSRRGKS